ncbi:uncharacterized protein LOC144621225 [Crassostrea virginica]
MILINFAILNFLILFDSVKGSAFLKLDPNTVILGDDNVTISCLDRFIKHVELQICLNKSDDWKPIAMVNLTRTCKLDPELTPMLRCSSFDGKKRFYSEEKSFPGVKGKPPKNMLAPSILSKQSIRINNRESSIDVLHLQCKGDVESVNARPDKDIRWCQKVSGKFKVLVFRIPPQTSTVSTSRNGCVVLQKSTINYSLPSRDSDVEIMCESGYSIANKECGEGSAHSTLYIRTDTLDEGSKFFVSKNKKIQFDLYFLTKGVLLFFA